MSKNFELLQRLEQEVTRRGTSAHAPLSGLGRGDAGIPTSPRDQEIAKLINVLSSPDTRTSLRVIVFADVEKQNGSTWICARTAELLSKTSSVCSVDANFQSPALHTHFGVDNTIGLLDVLVTGCPTENVVRWIPEGPAVISTGTADIAKAPSPSDTLNAAVTALRSDFEYVLIDAPPLRVDPYSVMLSRIADGLILVVQANSTRRDTAKEVKEELDSLNINLVGAVLNNRTFPLPEKIYRKL